MKSFVRSSLALLLAVIAGTVWLSANDDDRPAQVAGSLLTAKPQFRQLKRAEENADVFLFSDAEKLLGWISGGGDYEGQSVDIELRGKVHRVPVQKGNVFAWKHQVSTPATATVTFRNHRREHALSTLARGGNTAFFVVDRTVCRPGQEMRFAAFLRYQNEFGQFRPVRSGVCRVKLTSGGNTVAHKWELKPDSRGRIDGSYRFTEADALDKYRLAIEGFQGVAEVKLSEFRKAKVRLSIEGKRQGRRLRLKFQALDFLNESVAGSSVRFIARVFRTQGNDSKPSLRSDKFLYQTGVPSWMLHFDRRSEDERLLAEAGDLIVPSGRPTRQMVAELKGEIAIADSGAAEYYLPLEHSWLRGNFAVQIDGVLTDYNGREQRATEIIQVNSEVTHCDLELKVAKRIFTPAETIEVGIRPTDGKGNLVPAVSTVMAMKLTPSAAQQQPLYGGYGYGVYGYSIYSPYFSQGILGNQGRGWLGNGGDPQASDWRVAALSESALPRRTLITATVAKDGIARLRLPEAGAYKLVCIAQLADGSQRRNEVGCIVKVERDLPNLMLQIDRADLKSTEKLTGAIHTRIENARVLLTIRDSVGIKYWKSFVVRDGVQPLAIQLPEGLNYGATVEVFSNANQSRPSFDSKYIRVEPLDRTIGIAVKSKKVYSPGQMMHLGIKVDRRESVDLVVSVYDESLLGIAPDDSVNIRDFFLADERVRHSAALPLIDQLLGGVTVKQLMARADKQLSRHPNDYQLRHMLKRYRENHHLRSSDVNQLLRLAGVRTSFYPFHYAWRYNLKDKSEEKNQLTLASLLRKRHGNWSLQTTVRGSTLVLRESHPGVGAPRQFWGGGGAMGAGYAMAPVSGNGFFSANAGFSHQPMVSGQSFLSHTQALVSPGESFGGEYSIGEVRRDFSDSAYWNAKVRTNRLGYAKVRFQLPDSLTNWRVVVTAVSHKMHVGQTTSRFRTFKPIMVWPMLPRVFTEGDKVRVFASVHNQTEAARDISVELKAKNGVVLSPATVKVAVPPGKQVPVYWTFQADRPGFTELLMKADCSAGSDASLKRLPVTAMVAEQVITASGFTRDNGELTIPREVKLPDANLEIRFVPSLLADTLQSLEYLVDYPYGCVEQTMSRFLPALVVNKTLDRAGLENAALEKKLPKVMEMGIKRLLQLQRPDGGWAWQGGGQTHEMMTPYALYGLLQAKKAGYVIPHPSAIARGLRRLRKFIAAMGPKQAADRIYCMYVYSMAHKIDAKGWAFIAQQEKENQLSDYALALALEMSVAAEKDGLAKRLAGRLRGRATRTPEGVFWKTAGFSRWGNDRFEITAAALKALVAHDPEDPLIAPVISFFATTKRGNRWNSTKDTAMIIFGICDYLATQENIRSGERRIRVRVNEGSWQAVTLDDGLLPTVSVPADELKHGTNSLHFVGPTAGIMFRATLTYEQRKLQIQPLSKGLEVDRKFYLLDGRGNQIKQIRSGDSVPRGSYLESVVEVRNDAEDRMRYILVDNPKPASAEILPSTDERYKRSSTAFALREDRTESVAYHHEEAGKTIVDRCVLHLELGGDFLVRPARVELMYRTWTRGHSRPFRLKVE